MTTQNTPTEKDLLEAYLRFLDIELLTVAKALGNVGPEPDHILVPSRPEVMRFFSECQDPTRSDVTSRANAILGGLGIRPMPSRAA
ncbi:MAG: hypothetical protein HQL36_01965 [Alphaproteobacteria bacterium]|nr:hypothetical protein [Alphaproteobacteria bacterium]